MQLMGLEKEPAIFFILIEMRYYELEVDDGGGFFMTWEQFVEFWFNNSKFRGLLGLFKGLGLVNRSLAHF